MDLVVFAFLLFLLGAKDNVQECKKLQEFCEESLIITLSSREWISRGAHLLSGHYTIKFPQEMILQTLILSFFSSSGFLQQAHLYYAVV